MEITTFSSFFPKAFEINREAAKLEAQIEHDGEISADFCLAKGVGNLSNYTMVEEHLPLNNNVTVIGTFDNLNYAINGKNRRFGPNLIVYKGNRTELIERISKEVSGYLRGVLIMLGIAGAIGGYAAIV